MDRRCSGSNIREALRDWAMEKRNGMNDAEPTVFIVDDARQIRTALSCMLESAGYRVRSFDSAESFLKDHDAAVPGCLLLDVCMPGMSGLDLQRSLVDSPGARPIVFLTGKGDIQTSVHAMKEGAVDFLTKPIDGERLFAAVEQALRLDAKQRQERAVRTLIEQRVDSLTRREREVMIRIVRGRLNKQVGLELGIGEKTVKVHRMRVMRKMGAHSVAELVHLAARVELVHEPAASPGDAASVQRSAVDRDAQG